MAFLTWQLCVYKDFCVQAAYNVIAYKDNPRLRTAVEMLKTTQEIEQRLKEVFQSSDLFTLSC